MSRATLLTYHVLSTLFLLCALLHVLLPHYTLSSTTRITLHTLPQILLLRTTPLTLSTIDGILMLTAYVVALPATLLPTKRMRRNTGLLKAQAWLVVVCMLVALVIGLKIWFETLRTQEGLAKVWNGLGEFDRSMLQMRFRCCGFDVTTTGTSAASYSSGIDNGQGFTVPSNYVQDGTCPSDSVARQRGSCAVPFASFADGFLDIVFTAFFGFVAVEGMLLLAVLCLIQERGQARRWTEIEQGEKVGKGSRRRERG